MRGTLAADDIASGVVAQAAAGDVLALEQIVSRYHDDMTRVCVVVCGGDADLAQDAVQAAWPIVCRKLGTLRDAGHLRAWLLTVAANEARQLLRQRRRRVVVELDVADLEPSRHDPADSIRSVDLRAAVRRLDPEDRTLLALRYVAGFDSTELGHAVDGGSAERIATTFELLEVSGWSPDGTWIAFSEPDALDVVRADGSGSPVRIYALSTAARWSEHQRLFYLVAPNVPGGDSPSDWQGIGSIMVFDPAGGGIRRS